MPPLYQISFSNFVKPERFAKRSLSLMKQFCSWIMSTSPVKAYKSSREGFWLGIIAFIVQLSLVPTNWIVGSKSPKELTTLKALEAYASKRAKKIDLLILIKLLLAFGLLFGPSDVEVFSIVVCLLSGFGILNVLAAVLHFSILLNRRPASSLPSASSMVLSLPRSIVLALLNYTELILWFANIFRLVGDIKTNDPTLSPTTCIYFSGITSLTIGYGDLAPEGASRILTVLEGLCGILIIAILIGRLLSSMKPIDELRQILIDTEYEVI